MHELVHKEDRQLGPFTVLEKIGANNYSLELPSIVRLHLMSHVNNLRPCPTAMLYVLLF
jgi:hypothetical protein